VGLADREWIVGHSSPTFFAGHKEPDLSQVPSQAQKLLRRCLERDPKERLRDIGEARFLLEEGPQPAPSRSRLGIVASIAAAVFAVTLPVLLRSRAVLPYRAIRKHLGAVGE
jgi:hypothetical protein